MRLFKITIREAKTEEANTLTKIAFSAKRTWNYPEEYMAIWKDELTITDDYIDRNTVYVAERRNKIVGFYSIVLLKKDATFGEVLVKQGYWLDHLFIDPNYQYKGIGKKLINAIFNFCKENWIDELSIFVDPNSSEFYEKMGAKFVKNSPSSIKGREIPIYRFQI